MTMQMIDTGRLRPLLYDILLGATDPGDQMQLNQQMGVALSHAAQKGGVNIVQLQSASMNKVVAGVTTALKMLDERPELPELEEPVPVKEPESVVLERIIDRSLQSARSLADFVDEIEALYVKKALQKFGSKKETCNVLEIGYPKLQKIEGNIARLIP